MWVDAPFAPVGATPRSAVMYAMRTLRLPRDAEEALRPARDQPEPAEVDRGRWRRPVREFRAHRVEQRRGAESLRVDGAEKPPLLERMGPQPLFAARIDTRNDDG